MIKITMKKISLIISTISYLTSAVTSFAQTIQIQRPEIGGQGVGFTDVNQFIKNGVTLAFIIALVIGFIMLVWGAIQWIFSGGSKEGLEAARGRIIHALVGLAILAVAFAIVSLTATFVGVNLLNLVVPGPT